MPCLISIVVEHSLFAGTACHHIRYSAAVKIDFYLNGVTRIILAQDQSKVDRVYQKKRPTILLTFFLIVHSTLYDKEKAVLRQNNNQSKRKADALNAEAVSSADSNTSSQSTTFSLKKKQKKTASIKTLEGTVPGSWTLPLSQESEKSTSRLKKEQYCLLFADEILNGKVRQAVERLRIERLTDEEKQDPTTTRYLDFWKEGDSSPERKQNIHELLLGDKNDVRRLLELEGKLTRALSFFIVYINGFLML